VILAILVQDIVILSVGLFLGMLLRMRQNSSAKLPEAVCGCEHHHAMHDPVTGHCHALINGEPLKYNSWKEPTAWTQVQCPCRRYSGPEPLPVYYAGEIAREGE
jgi:hypothetical protein